MIIGIGTWSPAKMAEANVPVSGESVEAHGIAKTEAEIMDIVY